MDVSGFLKEWSADYSRANAQAASDLRKISEKAGEGWAFAPVPSEVLKKPPLLDLLIKSGSRLTLADIPPRAQRSSTKLRAAAFVLDAPSQTHRLLDQFGEPSLLLSECGSLGAYLIDHRCAKGLREMHYEHPQFIQNVFSQPPAIAALKVLGVFLNRQTKATTDMMLLAIECGTKWEQNQGNMAWLSPSQRALLNAFDAKWRPQVEAQQLQCAPVEPSPSRRPSRL